MCTGLSRESRQDTNYTNSKLLQSPCKLVHRSIRTRWSRIGETFYPKLSLSNGTGPRRYKLYKFKPSPIVVQIGTLVNSHTLITNMIFILSKTLSIKWHRAKKIPIVHSHTHTRCTFTVAFLQPCDVSSTHHTYTGTHCAYMLSLLSNVRTDTARTSCRFSMQPCSSCLFFLGKWFFWENSLYFGK